MKPFEFDPVAERAQAFYLHSTLPTITFTPEETTNLTLLNVTPNVEYDTIEMVNLLTDTLIESYQTYSDTVRLSDMVSAFVLALENRDQEFLLSNVFGKLIKNRGVKEGSVHLPTFDDRNSQTIARTIVNLSGTARKLSTILYLVHAIFKFDKFIETIADEWAAAFDTIGARSIPLFTSIDAIRDHKESNVEYVLNDTISPVIHSEHYNSYGAVLTIDIQDEEEDITEEEYVAVIVIAAFRKLVGAFEPNITQQATGGALVDAYLKFITAVHPLFTVIALNMETRFLNQWSRMSTSYEDLLKEVSEPLLKQMIYVYPYTNKFKGTFLMNRDKENNATVEEVYVDMFFRYTVTLDDPFTKTLWDAIGQREKLISEGIELPFSWLYEVVKEAEV